MNNENEQYSTQHSGWRHTSTACAYWPPEAIFNEQRDSSSKSRIVTMASVSLETGQLVKLLALKSTVKYPVARWSGNRNCHAFVSIYHELASHEKRNSFKWELSRDEKCAQQGSVGNWHWGAGKRQKPGNWNATQSNNSQFTSVVIVPTAFSPIEHSAVKKMLFPASECLKTNGILSTFKHLFKEINFLHIPCKWEMLTTTSQERD